MKRRSFLKSIIGCLALPFLPRGNGKFKDKKPDFISSKYVSYEDTYIILDGTINLKRVLDSCFLKEYYYVLVEGGELWRTAYPYGERWQLEFRFCSDINKIRPLYYFSGCWIEGFCSYGKQEIYHPVS